MVKQMIVIIKAIKSNINNKHASHTCTFSLSLKRKHTQTLAHMHFLSLPHSPLHAHTLKHSHTGTFSPSLSLSHVHKHRSKRTNLLDER